MNDFGTPMNDVEINMAPPGARHTIDQIKAESGMHNNIDFGTILGGAVNIIGDIIGGNKQDKAAKEAVKQQNKATEAQHQYNLDAWEMKKLQLQKDYDQAVLEIETRAANEFKQAEWQDAMAASRYNYDLMIRDMEQESLNAQFERSEHIYQEQINYNALAEKAARNDERHSLEDTLAKARFDEEDIRLQALMDEGAMRAKGLSGTSAEKAAAAVWAKSGKRLAALNATMEAAGRTSRSVMNEISRDRDTADLAALASRMLEPGELPDPIQPFETPLTTFVYPPVLEDFDFGPEPIKGAMMSASAASNRVWGSTIPSIASGIGTFASGFFKD